MKTRELTADEVNITISVEDISKIPVDSNPDLPTDPMAVDALKAGMLLRGRDSQMFVCGPSAPERLAITMVAVKDLLPGAMCDTVLVENSDNPYKPFVKKLKQGEAHEYVESLKKDGVKAVILNETEETVPVIIENNPIPQKLLGRDGNNIFQIDAGSILKSSGGVLLLNAEDLLEEPESWKLLKRIIRTGCTPVGTKAAGLLSEGMNYSADQLILPETEVDLKVIILGNEQHFDHFYNTDEDFRELFQFFVEFDSVIELDDKNLSDTVNYIKNFCTGRLGRKITDEALFECVKYSIAASENKTKLSTITSEIEFLVREASKIEEQSSENDTTENDITAKQIKAAVAHQSERYSLLERRIIEDIKSGEINLKVTGSETGKVNGLAVIDKGSWSFGSPGLISARIAPGENGLVNIEHEAGLSGEIHDKWVLILEGFLRSRFALDFPISIFASICFEQSYSEIDGDSASSSELYTLLSAIADVPIRQDIAVTGSLSQTGEIQAVGGLREKIEGFYKACRALGYTGNQGVIVPERNIKNIILPDEILEEIRKGQFHIYPVSTVDDSMEILTGREAGQRNSRGLFPHGTLNSLIEKNLKKLASLSKNFGN